MRIIFQASLGAFIIFSIFSAHTRAEVAGLDHLDKVTVTNCKPDDEEKPKNSPFGKLCNYSHRLCDVAAEGKTIFKGVYIDVDCVPDDAKACPKISECAKKKLPQNVADYVRSLNDPNSNERDDGAGIDMDSDYRSMGGSR